VCFIGIVVSCRSKTTSEESEPPSRKSAGESVSGSAETVTCPVCGLAFEKSDAAASETFNNEQFYFFIEDHHQAFKTDPAKYLSSAPATQQAVK
jgi:YHS domain-containing protein